MRPIDPAGGESQAAGSDRFWHVERARAELDAAYRAAGSREAAIHLKLCSLHLEQAGWQRPPSAGAGMERDWMGRCRPLHERALAS
jgi:hypothetical protein